MNRLVVVQIAVQLIHQALSQGTPEAKVVKNPLPDDAVLVAVNSDGRTVSLTYQSDAFEEVPEGNMIPCLDISYSRVGGGEVVHENS